MLGIRLIFDKATLRDKIFTRKISNFSERYYFVIKAKQLGEGLSNDHFC
jgi:hypothetical protein